MRFVHLVAQNSKELAELIQSEMSDIKSSRTGNSWRLVHCFHLIEARPATVSPLTVAGNQQPALIHEINVFLFLDDSKLPVSVSGTVETLKGF